MITNKRFHSYLKFMLAGGPSFVIGVGLNYLLVDLFHMWPPFAYVFVLIFQVSCNYLMCKLFVFKNKQEKRMLHEFSKFFGGILAFRVLDWGLYTIEVQFLGIYYIVAQIINVVLFSVLKFLFSEKILG